MLRKVVFSGLVYGQKPTGIHRYANEILMEMDKMISKDEVTLVVPVYAKNIPIFQNIKVDRYGTVKGLLWEQTSLLVYLVKNKAISINFTNSAPLFKPGAIVIHDISYKLNPSYYKSIHGFLAKWWHRFNYAWCAFWKVPILSDTEFSKKTIIENYHVKPERITVIGCGWEHIQRVEEDTNSLEKYGLEGNNYFFTLGSLSQRKNTEWIYKTARQMPEETFVVAGGFAKNSSLSINSIPLNVKLIGYISDEEMVSLMKNCKAFVFPSLFEGFGIPPLEAMSLGAPAIVAKASCLPEIYGDSVTYIDPLKPADNLIVFRDETKTVALLNKYSWRRSATQMLEYLHDLQN